MHLCASYHKNGEYVLIKFELDPSNIAPYLKLLVGTVEVSQVMQILAHVHLSLQGQTLVMTTSNTEMEVCVKIPVDMEHTGVTSFTVSARKLAEIIRLIDLKETMTWTNDGSWVHIAMGKVKYRLATLDADRFPFLVVSDNRTETQIQASVLRKLIDQTIFGVAKQDIRVYLNGLLLDFTPGHLTAVASDSHRMCLRTSEMDGIQHEVMQAIVPRRTALELTKLLATVPDGDMVSLSFADHIMGVSYGAWSLKSHLIDASYPPYRRIMVKETKAEVVLPVAALKNALARMSVCASDRFRGINLLVGENHLILKSTNFDQEEAVEEIAIDYNGDALQLSIGLSYFHDVINAVGCEKIILKVSSHEQSVMLVPEDDPSAVYMIMSYTV